MGTRGAFVPPRLRVSVKSILLHYGCLLWNLSCKLLKKGSGASCNFNILMQVLTCNINQSLAYYRDNTVRVVYCLTKRQLSFVRMFILSFYKVVYWNWPGGVNMMSDFRS